MSWPTISEYSEAIQNHHQNLADKQLRAGHVATNQLGIPSSWSGNFAVVYKIDCPATGKAWALKCFTRHIPDLHQRYQALSEHLRNVRLNYKVPFRYLQKGIRVGGQWYPAVKMQWVEGTPLHEFLENSLDNAAALRWLLNTWLNLADRLTACNIAHGDLQHGNVLVQDGSGRRRLRLVDYDGMCVPKLVGAGSHEQGHPAFQHPQRPQEGSYGLDVDRFSHLVIYTTLYCLRTGGKQLWSRFHNKDNLLFTEKDFKEPARSELFRQLWQLEDDDATALVGRLALACVRPIESVQPLCEIVTPTGINPLTTTEYRQVEQLLQTERARRNVFSVIRVHSGLGDLLVQQVQRAKPGQEIIMDPGVYLIPQSLKVDKPLEIVGREGAEKTFIHYAGQGPAISYTAGGLLRLKGLTVERVGGSGGLFQASTGITNIEDCRFHGATEAPGILLAGTVRGNISRCHISHNKASGIRLTDRASLDLEENLCERNGGTAIAYFGLSAGAARRNTCRENKQHGIGLAEQATPTLERNTCERNERCGIAYFGSSGGTARNNICRGNKQQDIYVGQDASPTLYEKSYETKYQATDQAVEAIREARYWALWGAILGAIGGAIWGTIWGAIGGLSTGGIGGAILGAIGQGILGTIRGGIIGAIGGAILGAIRATQSK